MKSKKILLLLCMLGIKVAVYADPLETGKTIFTTRCAACHNVNKVILGPSLAGIDQRRSIDWIVNFIQSSQTLVKKGDKDAIAVFEKFSKVVMPDHADLKEADITGILAYIKSETKAVETTTAPFAKPGKKRADNMPLSSDDTVFFIFFLGAVAALVRTLVFLVQMKTFTREQAENLGVIDPSSKLS